MKNTKRTFEWRKIIKGQLVDDSLLGQEYEVPELGRVLVTRLDEQDATKAGKNPTCRLVCYRVGEVNHAGKNQLRDQRHAAPYWTILGFGKFSWLDCR